MKYKNKGWRKGNSHFTSSHRFSRDIYKWGRGVGGGGGGFVVTISHNVPNNIARMFEQRKLTEVCKSFCELNFITLSNKCIRNCVSFFACVSR